MPRKRKKRKSKELEKEVYEVELDAWEVDYHFGINTIKNIILGDYWEHSSLILSGKIISPALKSATKAEIHIMARPELDDHWKEQAKENPPLATGWMEIPRGDDTLQISCSVPSRSFNYIPIAVASGKIGFARIFGAKLRWRRGKALEISLSTRREEE